MNTASIFFCPANGSLTCVASMVLALGGVGAQCAGLGGRRKLLTTCQYAYGSSEALSSAPIISLHSVRSQSRSCQTYSFALALRSSQKQTRPPLMYIRTVVSLGASLRFGLCARRAMVRSSSGFKVRVEVGVILCLTAGPNRRALGYCSSYRSIQSAANIKGEG